ncbi:MAG: hypothetical protein HY236_08700 [Acidobacteria bacterium]|nr:hypothetical protein [Acidobacteriota bacterium]
MRGVNGLTAAGADGQCRARVCIICHGRSNLNAIKNAIRVAMEFSKGRINDTIEAALPRAPRRQVSGAAD